MKLDQKALTIFKLCTSNPMFVRVLRFDGNLPCFPLEINSQTASLPLFDRFLYSLIFDIDRTLTCSVSIIKHRVNSILIDGCRGLQCGGLDLGGVSVV